MISRISNLKKQQLIMRNAYFLLEIVAAVSMAVLFLLIVQQSHRISKQTSIIQQQRIDSILNECRATNERHDKSISTLLYLLKKAGVSNQRRKASAAATISLIDALAPKRNCLDLVQRAVPTEQPVR